MKEIFKRIIISVSAVIAWLVFFDLGAQIVLCILDNEELNRYFSYGLSTEMQIRKMFDEYIPEDSVLHAGWIEKEKFIERGDSADITFYGMSFSNHIAEQLGDLNREIIIREVDGPAAPINHSLSSFLVDRDICCSKIAVLAILDSSLKYINAMSNDTIGVDSPYCSFYPKFYDDKGTLKMAKPAIGSFEDLEASLNDKALWDSHLEVLELYDDYYTPIIYKRNLMDYSLIGRFVKRWYKGYHNKRITQNVYANGKFNDQVIDQSEQLLRLFAEAARDKGIKPVVLLIETQAYGNALSKDFSPFLKENEIEFIYTSSIVSTSNPSNFKEDGHIVMERNHDIAEKLNDLILEM